MLWVSSSVKKFFEKCLPVKTFQKGNQLIIQGKKESIEIIKIAVSQTIKEKKQKKKVDFDINVMQENLKMQILIVSQFFFIHNDIP